MAGTTLNDPNREAVGLPPIWTGAPDDGPEATGATAGIPGTWTPAGAQPPDNPTELAQGNPNVVVASPATPWTSGQYVQTMLAGAAGRATWSGTDWVGGAAPLDDDPGGDLPGHPEAFTVEQVKAWVDEYPHFAADVLAHEQARGGQARITLVDFLTGFVESHDGVDQP